MSRIAREQYKLSYILLTSNYDAKQARAVILRSIRRCKDETSGDDLRT